MFESRMKLRALTPSNEELIARIELRSAQVALLATAQGIPLEHFAGTFATNQARIDLLKAVMRDELDAA